MRKPRGLRYVSDSNLTWTRQKSGNGFRFLNSRKKRLGKADEMRVRSLVIPPAWRRVRISPDKNGHILATGLDDKGRKQYIYHPDWIAYNQQAKFDFMLKFGEILPTIRQTTGEHMRHRTLTRERILATIVWLLEHTFIRVGNRAYAKENQSYGLTTMRNKHVEVEGNTVSFSFKGKSNVYHELDVRHPRVATTIRQCIELPGYELFQYLDEGGDRHTVDSADVNTYLKEISGEDLSAKDFRTWGGTTIASRTLYEMGEPNDELPLEKVITQAVETVSEHLGNTPAVCRQYYIHPKILQSYEQARLAPHFHRVYRASHRVPDGLTPEEHATLFILNE